MAEKAILYDSTRCTACRGCQTMCKEWNENDSAIPDKEGGVNSTNRGSYENPKDLSPNTWLKITFNEVEHYGKVDWLFGRRACMHCTDAACVKVCPNGSMYKDPVYGYTGLNTDTCTGCGYCVEFCPFDVPRLSGSTIIGNTKSSKCVMCTQPGMNRLEAGYEPACVKTCPTDALTFDDRDKQIAVGQSKVTDLKAAGYPNANLYGVNEMGGLHVLYVLNDTPDKYGLPVAPKVPDTAIAWQDIIQPIGWAVGGLTILGLALNYIVAREAGMTKSLPGKKEKDNGTKK